jgi:Uma2 family endonuclease
MALQLARRLFTVAEFHQMAEAGVFGEDDRIELVEGEILEMSPIGSHHAARVARLQQRLSFAVSERALIWVQNPVRLDDRSEPQPDLALLEVRRDFYEAALPGPDNVLLIVEIADSSAEYDRQIKAPLYARCAIAEYWLVDLLRQVVTVYRDPSLDGYRSVRVAQPGQQISPLAFPDVQLDVSDIVA